MNLESASLHMRHVGVVGCVIAGNEHLIGDVVLQDI